MLLVHKELVAVRARVCARARMCVGTPAQMNDGACSHSVSYRSSAEPWVGVGSPS